MSRWYPLLCKPGQRKTEYRGELEVTVGFTVRASQGRRDSVSKGSLSSLNKVTDMPVPVCLSVYLSSGCYRYWRVPS